MMHLWALQQPATTPAAPTGQLDTLYGDVAGKYGSGFSLQKGYEAINSEKYPWLS